MKYVGKLYGKVNRRYIPMMMTSEDVDKVMEDLAAARAELARLRDVVCEEDAESIKRVLTSDHVVTP